MFRTKHIRWLLSLLLFSYISNTYAGVCGTSATPISKIQGVGKNSSLVNKTATVEAVVTAVFQGNQKEDKQLSGFFVQEAHVDQDHIPYSSEGLFIYHNTTKIKPGERLRLTGTITEYADSTQLQKLTQIVRCGQVALPAPQELTLPLKNANIEHLEGMRVSLPQSLTITLGRGFQRYGTIYLSQGRRFTPTELYLPLSNKAKALAESNRLNQLLLDDSSIEKYPQRISYLPGLSAKHPLRSGDQVSNLTGIIHHAFGEYRIIPTEQPKFETQNPRNSSPHLPKQTNLIVAGYNLLNLFKDLDRGGKKGYRGANTKLELKRQLEKHSATLLAMDADIVGLIELENDGLEPDSTIALLTKAVNAKLPKEKHYSYIRPSINVRGGDIITLGMLYRHNSVSPQGGAETISRYPFDSRTRKHRKPLIQRFRHQQSNQEITLVLNHLKSKGSSCKALGDPNRHDGQGNCSAQRTAAAKTLATELKGRKNLLLMGDFNAYSMESPIQLLVKNGYKLLSNQYAERHYSYVYRGLSGSLDHAFADDTLSRYVLWAGSWHTNADESTLFDYNSEHKTAEQIKRYYNADPYRSSDHDPMLVALHLLPAQE